MRIEAYTQVQQVYQTRKMSKSQSAGSVSQGDQLQISSFGRDIQIAKAALAGSPDIREELTARVKAQVQSGAYSVDNAAFAGKLLQKYDEMR